MGKIAVVVVCALGVFSNLTKAYAPLAPHPKPKKTISKSVYGPPLVSRSMVSVEQPKANWVEFIVTEYTANQESTGKNPGDPAYGITANGEKAHIGGVACSPQYPFGTTFIVDGFGTYTCNDRGGAIQGNHIDVFQPVLSKALEFGKKIMQVQIILPK